MIERLTGELHELTAQIAYERWARRGRPLWSADVDWFAAQKDLAALKTRTDEMVSFFSVSMEANEEPTL